MGEMLLIMIMFPKNGLLPRSPDVSLRLSLPPPLPLPTHNETPQASLWGLVVDAVFGCR